MRTLGWLAILAAVGYGAWWWWRRSGGANPLAFLDPPTGAGHEYYTPPAAPLAPAPAGTVGGGWLDTASGYGNVAIDKFGGVSQEVFTSLCGTGKACSALAPAANLAGKATAAITVKSIEYTAKGAKKVFHAITPW